MLSKTQLKSKTPLLVALLFATSCAENFDWEPRPYQGDSVSQSVILFDGTAIRCDEPRFDQMTCFDPANIAELKTAIDQVENKKRKKKAMEAFRKTFPAHK